MTTTITPQQNKRLHTLLTVCNLTDADDKKALVRAYSHQRTESSRELTMAEAEALIAHLAITESQLLPTKRTQTFTVLPGDAQRKKIISLAHEMRWKLPDGRADMARINDWCRQKSYLKKGLNAYTEPELPKLVSQFEIVYQSYIDSLTKGK
jgi:hypothetical protein